MKVINLSKKIVVDAEIEINNIFDNIKELVITSKNKVYSNINTEMLNLNFNCLNLYI